MTIDVLPVGHAPVGTSGTARVPAGPSYAIQAADFGFTDPNDTPADTFSRVKITTLPTAGSLTLAGVPVTAGQFVTVADLAAGNLVLTPATGRPHASLTFQVEDSTSTTNGGENLDPDPKTLVFNSPPVVQDDFYSIMENQTLDEALLGDHLRLIATGPWSDASVITTDVDGSNGQCTATGNGNSVTFSYPSPTGYYFGGHTLTFAAPGTSPLTPGLYTGAKSTADANSPGMSIDGISLGGDSTTQQFTVLEAVYDPAGNVERFDATFELKIPWQSYSIAGRVQYHASAVLGTSVLANDTDADGDPIAFAAPPFSVITLNDTLRLQSGVLDAWPVPWPHTPVTEPQHGTLSFYNDGGFVYTPDTNFSGTDSFQYEVYDGMNLSNVATVWIQVNDISRAPVGTSATIAIPASGPYTILAADFGFTDPLDTVPNTLTRVEITTLPTTGALTLAGAPVAAGQFVTAAQLAAGDLVFAPTAGATFGQDPSFTFQVEDSGSTANGGTILDATPKTLALHISPTATDDFYTVDENGVLDRRGFSRLTITSPPGENIGGGQTYDLDDTDGTFTVDQGNRNDVGIIVRAGGGAFFWYCGFSAPSGARLVPGVYEHATNSGSESSQFPGINVYSYNVGLPEVATGKFTVNEVEYAPSGEIFRFDATFEQQELPGAPTLSGRIQYHIQQANALDVLDNDTSTADYPLSSVLVNGPQHGTLTLTPDGSFVYEPELNFYGVDSFQYKDDDGVAQSSVATVTIDVNHVSQAPMGTSGIVHMPTETPYPLKVADFGFTDPNDTPADTFIGVRITALPEAGTLTLAGVPVSAGQFITVGDLLAGSLKFSPPAGGPHATLSFQVEDSGSTANGGVVVDSNPKQLTFNVVPAVHDDSYIVNENATLDQRIFTAHLTLLVDGFSGVSSTYEFDQQNADFFANPYYNGVQVYCNSDSDSWSLVFQPPWNGPLFPYVYNNVTSGPNDWNSDLWVHKSTQNTWGHLRGQFTVNTIVFGPSGEVQQFDADFQQTTEYYGSVSGHVQFSAVPRATSVGLLSNDADADGDPLAVTVVDGPQHGILHLDANGGFAYTPEADFFGMDSFRYKASDGWVDSPPAVVAITVNHVSQAPSGADTAVTVAPGVVYSVKTADFGFTDPHEHPADSFTRVKITALPVAGTLRLAGQPVTTGQFISVADIVNGKLTFTASPREFRTARVALAFQVEDSGSVENGGLPLDPVPNSLAFNTAPVAHDDSYAVNENATLNQSLLVTRLTMTSEPGDWIGDGLSYDLSGSNAQFSASGNSHSVEIGVSSANDSWIVCFEAAAGSNLVPGTYFFPSEDYYSPSPYLSVIHGNRVPYYVSGQFTVTQAVFGPAGEIEQFDATFEQHAGSPNALTGRVQFHSSATGATSVLTNDVDADGDPLTAILVSDPQHGTLDFDRFGGFIYTPATGFTGTDTFEYKANDGTTNGNSAVVRITVDGISEAPTGTSSVARLQSRASYPLKVSDFGFADPRDLSPDRFTRVKIATLPTAGTLRLAGRPVKVGQYVSVASVRAGKLKFTPPAHPAADTHPSFTFQVEDSGNAAHGDAILDPSPETLAFNVAPAAAADSFTTFENATLQVPWTTGLLKNDVDQERDLLTAVLVAAPQHGDLTLDPSGGFSYTPNAGFRGTDSFRYKSNDGMADSRAATVSIRIRPIVHPPTGTDTTITMAINATYTIGIADFGFKAPFDAVESSPGTNPCKSGSEFLGQLLGNLVRSVTTGVSMQDSAVSCSGFAFRAVKITTLPAAGILRLANAPVVAGQFISASNIASGLLTFMPEANATGAPYAGFTFQVLDNGGTANGRSDMDLTPRTMVFNVSSTRRSASGEGSTSLLTAGGTISGKLSLGRLAQAHDAIFAKNAVYGPKYG